MSVPQQPRTAAQPLPAQEQAQGGTGAQLQPTVPLRPLPILPIPVPAEFAISSLRAPPAEDPISKLQFTLTNILSLFHSAVQSLPEISQSVTPEGELYKPEESTETEREDGDGMEGEGEGDGMQQEGDGGELVGWPGSLRTNALPFARKILLSIETAEKVIAELPLLPLDGSPPTGMLEEIAKLEKQRIASDAKLRQSAEKAERLYRCLREEAERQSARRVEEQQAASRLGGRPRRPEEADLLGLQRRLAPFIGEVLEGDGPGERDENGGESDALGGSGESVGCQAGGDNWEGDEDF